MTTVNPEYQPRTDVVATGWMSNKTYDVLKYIAQIVLPALAAAYFGLGKIWGLPNVEEIVGTITVIDTFLGVLLGISTNKYNKTEASRDGALTIDTTTPGTELYRLRLNAPIDQIREKDKITLTLNS